MPLLPANETMKRLFTEIFMGREKIEVALV